MEKQLFEELKYPINLQIRSIKMRTRSGDLIEMEGSYFPNCIKIDFGNAKLLGVLP